MSATLSKRGMYLHASEPLPIGTRVELLLEVNGRPLYFGEAVVNFVFPQVLAQRHGWPPGFSVAFESLPARSQALIHQLIEISDRARTSRAPAVPRHPPPRMDLRRRRWPFATAWGLVAVAALALSLLP